MRSKNSRYVSQLGEVGCRKVCYILKWKKREKNIEIYTKKTEFFLFTRDNDKTLLLCYAILDLRHLGSSWVCVYESVW